MKFDPQRHHRRSVRLADYDYSQPGAYFVTMVTQGRACLFGDVVNGEMQLSDMGRIAGECWRAVPEHFPNVELGTFVVMPNHVHGIIVLHDRADAEASARRGTIYRAPTATDDAPTAIDDAPAERFQKPVPGSIPTIVRTYKAAVAREIVQQHGGVPIIWQRNYYEHIIRDDEEHNRIHFYIESNVDNWTLDNENPVKPA